MYRAIQTSGRRAAKASITTTFAKSGINKRDYEQLLDTKYAIDIINYFVEADGRLVKRGGLEELFNVVGANAISMIEKYTDNLYMFAYSNIVAVYDVSADTVTTIKSDFLTGEPFSGAKYGDYFFTCNGGGDKIGSITQTLDYDTQTADFAVGAILTGGTSGATAVILEDTDAGATGTLTLGEIVGTFVTAETITDSATGSAKANGALGFTYTEITDAPSAKYLFVSDARLIAGNLTGDIVGGKKGDASTIVWCDIDTGTNPPCTNWTTAASPPLAGEPASLRFRNAGAVKGFGALGNQIVVIYDSGKAGFRIDTVDVTGVGLAQDTKIDFQKIDFGGERGVASTPKGIFYCNEGGIFMSIAGGQTNVPYSEQESKISQLLGIEYTDNISFTNSDIVYDPKRNNVMITCAQDSVTNNLVLVYNLDNKSWVTFKGWNISRFMIINDVLYGADTTKTTVYELFKGTLDNGKNIETKYLQEFQLGSFSQRKDMLKFFIQGGLSLSSLVTVGFNIKNRIGTFVPAKLSFPWTAGGDEGLAVGYGDSSWGSSPFGGDSETGGLTEDFSGGNACIRNFQRLQINISSNDPVHHEINLFQAEIANKGSIRRRNLLSN